MIDPTDIIALVLMALFVMKRMELRATDERAFPRVAKADFEAWRERALSARNLSVNACFLKVAVNTIWYFGLRNRVGPHFLQTGGLVFFAVWILALAYAWWLFSSAKGIAERLGIVIGRRLVETPRS